MLTYSKMLSSLVGYLSVFVSNFVLIYSLPLDIASEVLEYLSILSGAISIIFIIGFATKNIQNSFLLYTNIVLVLLFFVFYYLAQNTNFLLVFIWVYSHFTFDFWSTQTPIKNKILLRVCFFLLTCFLIFIFGAFSEFTFLIRSIFCIFCFYFLGKGYITKKLSLVNSYSYVFITHLLYYLPLWLISISISVLQVKLIYICMQLFMQIILRLFDYKIRAISMLPKYTFSYFFAFHALLGILFGIAIYSFTNEILISFLPLIVHVFFRFTYNHSIKIKNED